MYELRAIAYKISNISQLRQLHGHLVLNSLHSHNYWVSLLLIFCTRLHAHPAYAASIFNSLPSPDASIYSCMLKYYSRMGANNEVVSLFRCMQSLDLRPQPFVYIYLIKLAGKYGNLFHAYVLKLGLVDDHFIRNAILDMYAKYGQVDLARKLFEQMAERTLADWNSMISGCWKSGNETDAVMLFNMMPARNIITWTAMVTGYAKMGDLESARRYFDEMPERSVVSWNAMLSAYAQNECAEEALKLFHQMLKEGITPDDTTWVATISSCSSIGNPTLADSILRKINQKHSILNNFVKTALLDMHAKFGNLEFAKTIFDELGGQRNAVTWNIMISAYTRVGKLSLARELFDNMPKRDVVSWNSMIAGYAQNGESAKSIELFQEMISCTDIQPDEVTVASVLSACGHIGALKLSYWVLDIVQEKNIKLGISGFNSLIFLYSKCGCVADAHRIFQTMETKDVVSFNTLISGFAANGHGKEAVKLALTMEEEGIEPDHVTYTGVLTACSHAGLLKEGKDVFKSIKSPTVDHYACMVDLLGRAGELDEAKILIQSMPMEPHAGVYGSLLNASRIHKRVELGELAANKLFELEPQNPGNYVLLSNIYASAGRWEDVKKVREKMRNGGLKKSVGMSWVEYKGQVHKFIVGDRSHERSKDIYRLLAELERKMKRVGFVADKSCALRDVEEEEKEEMLGTHSEKLAICFALLVSEVGTPIRVVKNLRICLDCHTAIKIISKLEEREIIVRDNNRFHCFRDGICSCHDYW